MHSLIWERAKHRREIPWTVQYNIMYYSNGAINLNVVILSMKCSEMLSSEECCRFRTSVSITACASRRSEETAEI